jgi:hypothetical protein
MALPSSHLTEVMSPFADVNKRGCNLSLKVWAEKLKIQEK